MDFYKMLSKHYDAIFPVNDNLINLIREITPVKGRILDVGCATGALIRKLNSENYDVEGLEYVPELVGYSEKTQIGDMHSLPYGDGEFDTLLCTGNTLAHVENADRAKQVMSEFARVLKQGGQCIIQILNYDMILKKRPAGLPLIKTDDVIFERYYEYGEGSIKFSGRITSGENTDESFVTLYPLTNGELDQAAGSRGLSPVSTYGGFDKSPYQPESSFPLVKIIQK